MAARSGLTSGDSREGLVLLTKSPNLDKLRSRTGAESDVGGEVGAAARIG